MDCRNINTKEFSNININSVDEYAQRHICIYHTCNQYVTNFHKVVDTQKSAIKNISKVLEKYVVLNVKPNYPTNLVKFPSSLKALKESLQKYNESINLYMLGKSDSIRIPSALNGLQNASSAGNYNKDEVLEMFSVAALRKEIEIVMYGQSRVGNAELSRFENEPIDLPNKDYNKLLVHVYHETYKMLTRFLLYAFVNGYILREHKDKLFAISGEQKSKRLEDIIVSLNDLRVFYLKSMNLEQNVMFLKYKDKLKFVKPMKILYDKFSLLFANRDWVNKNKENIAKHLRDVAIVLDFSKVDGLRKTANTQVNRLDNVDTFANNMKILNGYERQSFDIFENMTPQSFNKCFKGYTDLTNLQNFNQDEYNKLLIAYQKLDGAVRVILVPFLKRLNLNPQGGKKLIQCSGKQIENLDKQLNTNSMATNSGPYKVCKFPANKILFSEDKVSLKDIYDKSKTYGPFYSVAVNTQNDGQLMGKLDIESVCEYLKSGSNNNVFLFTYGYSGAGKTTNIFGFNGEGGILREMLVNMKAYKDKDPGVSVEVERMLMTYGYLDVVDNGSLKFIETIRELPKHKGTKLDLNNIDVELAKLQVIDDVGDIQFVKQTPNNKNSSRGFLFYYFNVSTSNTKSKLCLVDMAGNEHPYDIMMKILPTYKLPKSLEWNSPFAFDGKNMFNTMDITQKDFIANLVKQQLSYTVSKIITQLEKLLVFLKVPKLQNSFHIHMTNIIDFVEYFTVLEGKRDVSTKSEKFDSPFRDKLFEVSIDVLFNLVDCKDCKNLKYVQDIMNYNIKVIFLQGIVKSFDMVKSLPCDINEFIYYDVSKKTQPVKQNIVDLKDKIESMLNNSLTTKVQPRLKLNKNNTIYEVIVDYIRKVQKVLREKHKISTDFDDKDLFFAWNSGIENGVTAKGKGTVIPYCLLNVNCEKYDYYEFLAYYFCKKIILDTMACPGNIPAKSGASAKTVSDCYSILLPKSKTETIKLFADESKEKEFLTFAKSPSQDLKNVSFANYSLENVEQALFRELFNPKEKNMFKIEFLSILKFILSIEKFDDKLTFSSSISSSATFTLLKLEFRLQDGKLPNDNGNSFIITYDAASFRSYLEGRNYKVYCDDPISANHKYFEQIIKEGFYINQFNNELIRHIKQSKVDMSQDYLCKRQGGVMKKCDINILNLQQYDSTKMFDIQKETKNESSIGIDDIFKDINDSIVIMLCALRVEPEVNYRLGAIQTLDLIEKLKTT